jgi:hypothetical protein
MLAMWTGSFAVFSAAAAPNIATISKSFMLALVWLALERSCESKYKRGAT